MENNSEYKMIENFCNKVINNKCYYNHSDINFYVIIRLNSIKNFIKLITSSEDKEILNKNTSCNNYYVKNIQKYNNSNSNNNINNQHDNKSPLFKITIPYLEIYFKAKLIVGGIPICPELKTDIVTTDVFDIPLNFKYKIKELTNEDYISISIYTTQLPIDRSYLGCCEVRLFDLDNLTLNQGVKVVKIFNKNELANLSNNANNNNAFLQENNNNSNITNNSIYYDMQNTVYNDSNNNNNKNLDSNICSISNDINNDIIMPSNSKPVISDSEILNNRNNRNSKSIFISKQLESKLDKLVKNYYNNISNKPVHNVNFNINYNYISNDNKYNNNVNTINNDNNDLSKSEFIQFRNNFINTEKQLLYESEDAYLEIEFISFDYPVVYVEESRISKSNIFNSFVYSKSKTHKGDFYIDNNYICDIEMRKNNNFLLKDNPITEKFLALSRLNDEAFAKEIKPNPIESKAIENLIPTPDFIKLSSSDLYLFWKFRYYLLNRKNCLTKILNSVQWGESKSENEFLNNILYSWNSVEIGDILYMLSFKFCMNPLYSKHIYPRVNQVRYYAVNQLKKISNDDIEFVLLQLVQALRYEERNDSYLKKYLIARCADDLKLASSFYWFLNVEADETKMNNDLNLKTNTDNIIDNNKNINSKDNKIEVEIRMTEFYRNILNEFYSNLNKTIKNGIENQLMLRGKLIDVANEISKCKNKEQRSKKLPLIIKAGGTHDLSSFANPLNLPLDPNIKATSAIHDKGLVFASAKFPVKYSFYTSNELIEDNDLNNENNDKKIVDNTADKSNNLFSSNIYEIMFKYGDDLRQDQLILQIIAFMDALLRKINIDMQFTTYKVLATSKSDGFVEFVSDCKTISEILKKNNNSLSPYFKYLSKTNNLSYDIILDNYITSCAGYCVVTYILEIGDRHLENILINKVGKLFHIDFGYILGKDPKPYPPPMKLREQMVECMGKEFSTFKKKCCDTYLYLRQNARLIVNMFYLMVHCGITELSENYEQVLNKLHDKFKPNLNNEEASISLNTKLEESLSALFPKLMDFIHDLVNK